MSKRDLHNSLVIVSIFLVIGFFVDSSGATKCKSALKNSVIERCSGVGVRNRRNVENNPALQLEADGEAVHHHDKRQLDNPGATIASLAAPIVTEVVNGALRLQSYQAPPPAPSLLNFGVVPYPMASGTPQLYISSAPPQPTLTSSLWSQEMKDDAGIEGELTDDELEELYAELLQRLPRQLKGSMNKIDFFKVADECCRNISFCGKYSEDIMGCV